MQTYIHGGGGATSVQEPPGAYRTSKQAFDHERVLWCLLALASPIRQISPKFSEK